MHCIERKAVARAGGLLALVALAALVASCSSPKSPPAPVVSSQPAVVEPPGMGNRTAPSTQAPPSATQPTNAARARNWEEWRHAAAQKLVAANRAATYGGEVPEPLLAIPILEIELNADGSVRRIVVARQPTQARDTVQMAIDAVHRAAPFADVSHLPKPWKYTEVFLFADDRRFKPRTLDL